MCNSSPRDDDKKPLWLGLGGQEGTCHDPRQVFGLYCHFDINNYPINLGFHVTRLRSGYYAFAKTVAFDYASDADYQEPVLLRLIKALPF